MGPVNSDLLCKNATYKNAGSFHYEKKSSFKKYCNRLSVYLIHIWWNGSQPLYSIEIHTGVESTSLYKNEIMSLVYVNFKTPWN